jgi:uncharacterized RDD family membrane protein YckC
MTEQVSSIFPERPTYASFWERFGASFLDGIIVWVIGTVIRLILGGSLMATDLNLRDTLLPIIIGWLYFALQESGPKQATLGKKALNIKVCNMEYGRISFLQATGRHFGRYLSALILFIGYLMMLWDQKKQTLHDKMAGTLVISGKAED